LCCFAVLLALRRDVFLTAEREEYEEYDVSNPRS
jgi:hypothetical protein